MKREEMIERAVKGLTMLSLDKVSDDKTIVTLLQPLLEDVVDAYLQPGMVIIVSDEWVPNLPLPVLDGNIREWTPPTEASLRVPPISLLMERLQATTKNGLLALGINAWTKDISIGAGPQVGIGIWVQVGNQRPRSIHLRTETFPRGLPQHTKQYIPDVDSRSINEPCYLMSAKDVRNIFGGHYPEYWEFEKLKSLAEQQGWYDVTQYGNQILFRAKLSIRREEV